MTKSNAHDEDGGSGDPLTAISPRRRLRFSAQAPKGSADDETPVTSFQSVSTEDGEDSDGSHKSRSDGSRSMRSLKLFLRSDHAGKPEKGAELEQRFPDSARTVAHEVSFLPQDPLPREHDKTRKSFKEMEKLAQAMQTRKSGASTRHSPPSQQSPVETHLPPAQSSSPRVKKKAPKEGADGSAASPRAKQHASEAATGKGGAPQTKSRTGQQSAQDQNRGDDGGMHRTKSPGGQQSGQPQDRGDDTQQKPSLRGRGSVSFIAKTCPKEPRTEPECQPAARPLPRGATFSKFSGGHEAANDGADGRRGMPRTKSRSGQPSGEGQDRGQDSQQTPPRAGRSSLSFIAKKTPKEPAAARASAAPEKQPAARSLPRGATFSYGHNRR
jgi:hypothetical protein